MGALDSYYKFIYDSVKSTDHYIGAILLNVGINAFIAVAVDIIVSTSVIYVNPNESLTLFVVTFIQTTIGYFKWYIKHYW